MSTDPTKRAKIQSQKAQNPVKTVERTFAILEHLQENRGARISELTQQTGLAKSTVHRHLVTLLDYGYVTKEGDHYELGMKLLSFGEFVRNKKAAYKLAKPKVKELAQRTGERAMFLVEEHGRAIFVHREEGEHAVQIDITVGDHIPLHVSAAGKAILAHLPESRRKQLLDQLTLEQHTENTITDRDEMVKELKKIREQGYSDSKQESIKGLRAVGAPVFGKDETVVGALSVAGPTHRLKGERVEREIPDLLLGTANELELNIAHQ